jgi:hypothetical protein
MVLQWICTDFSSASDWKLAKYGVAFVALHLGFLQLTLRNGIFPPHDISNLVLNEKRFRPGVHRAAKKRLITA